MAKRRPSPPKRVPAPVLAPESSRTSAAAAASSSFVGASLRPARPPRAFLALAIFALVFIGESVYSYRQKSATWDEPIHVADGYFSLFKADYRFDPEHPPFLRMLAALSLAGLDIKSDTTVIDATDSDTWAINRIYDDTHRFMYEQNDADRLLYRSRFVIVLLGVLLGVLAFCWTYEWLGFTPALAVLAMIALEPNLVAHFSLVTTDAPLTTFAFGALYFLWRTVRRPDAVNVAVVCLFCALSAITKFSAALLYPAAFLLLAAAAVLYRSLAVSRAALIAVLIVITSWLSIWLVYRFQYLPSAQTTWVYHFQDNPNIAERVPGLTRIVQWIDGQHLLPNVFSQGFLLGQAKAQQRGAFLAGHVTDTGWWYFFPVAIAIKTPLPFLLLIIGGGIGLARSGWREPMIAFLTVPVAAFLFPPMLSSINIGLRHVLVIYPFLALLAAYGVTRLLAVNRGGLVLGVLTLLWVVEYGRTYPDVLAFFNTAVGGPSHGAAYLVDSNLDWGQDLKGLKQWMDANRVAEINLAYFGSADPAYYGMRARMLNGSPSFGRPDTIVPPRLPGYVAVSATIMSGVNFDAAHRDYYKPLLVQPRVASIGHSIDVYWVDRPWW